MVAHRAEALAIVALTRSPKVEPIRFDFGTLDFIAYIQETRGGRYCFFGVDVKATIALGSVDAANKYGHTINKDGKLTAKTYFFPTIVLLFSMQDEMGYFAWHMEPKKSKDRVTLTQHSELEFEPFDASALVRVIALVSSWYDSVEAAVAK